VQQKLTLESKALLRRCRRVRVADALSLEELIIAFGVLGILMALAAREYIPLVHRAQFVEIIQISKLIKYDLVLYHAETGAWPAPTQLSPSVQTWTGKFTTVPRLQTSRGSFNMLIRATPAMDVPSVDWNLSFLGENLLSSTGGPYLWRCGYGRRLKAAGGYDAPNLTDVPADYLPFICRR
jgi:hypothetical protein